jgi:hypothetical protein
MSKKRNKGARVKAIQKAQKRKHQKRVMKKYNSGKEFIEGFYGTLPGLIENFQHLRKDFECLQFQCIVMDLESIKEHLESIANEGPKPPMREVPLEESEQGIQEGDMPREMKEEVQEQQELSLVEREAFAQEPKTQEMSAPTKELGEE